MSDKRLTGIYIHWPFCLSKCPYCDFNSHLAGHIDADQWGCAYENWLEIYRPYLQYHAKNGRIESVFFGGGTPSLMPVSLVDRILTKIADINGGVLPDEVTLEANPTSVENAKFKDLSQSGVSRISIGVQSLRDKDLAFLGRQHNADEALQALKIAHKYFDRASFDLIYARPGQTLDDWRDELNQAMAYEIGHLSLYQLTVEPQTPFHLRYRKGEFALPDDGTSIAMYDMTHDILANHGMVDYEVSNYARPGQECRHNMLYWQGHEYIGVGPGAHGRIVDNTADGQARWVETRHHRAPEIWLSQALNLNPDQAIRDIGHGRFTADNRQFMGDMERLQEIIMMGLRLADGVDLNIARLKSFFPYQGENYLTDLIGQTVKSDAVKTMVAAGYMTQNQHVIQATHQGRMVLNSLLENILA